MTPPLDWRFPEVPADYDGYEHTVETDGGE
jgi:hypothetical protein